MIPLAIALTLAGIIAGALTIATILAEREAR